MLRFWADGDLHSEGCCCGQKKNELQFDLWLFLVIWWSAARPFEDGCSRWEELYQFFYPRHLSSPKDLCVQVMSSLLGICESWTRLRRMLWLALFTREKIPRSPSGLRPPPSSGKLFIGKEWRDILHDAPQQHKNAARSACNHSQKMLFVREIKKFNEWEGGSIC